MKVYLIVISDIDGDLTVGVETDLDKATVLFNEVSKHEEDSYNLVTLREWETATQEYNCLKYSGREISTDD